MLRQDILRHLAGPRDTDEAPGHGFPRAQVAAAALLVDCARVDANFSEDGHVTRAEGRSAAGADTDQIGMHVGGPRERRRRRSALAMLPGALAMALAAVGTAGESPQQAITSRLATQTLLLDGARAGGRLVAVGEWGHVVLSDDGGKSWRQAQLVPTRMTLTEVAFADARQGWAVGHDAVVLRTGDGGETWQVQFSAPQDKATLLSVWLENADHAIAVGSFGMVIETRDGGRHWERQPRLELDEEQPHLNHLFAGPESSLFIAAEFGSVFRSRDGGRTWRHLQLPYEGSLWGGLSLDGAILVLGMRGHVFRSEDLGESWTAVESGTDQSLQAAAQLADGTVVMVGLGGVVATSTDSGRRFTAAIEADRRGIAAVAEGANGVLLLFGETGIKARVRDGAGPRTSPPN